jgi:hypothetical protein
LITSKINDEIRKVASKEDDENFMKRRKFLSLLKVMEN